MTGLVFVTINPGSIWVQFMFSEIISYLASSHKEGLRMITKKVFNEFNHSTPPVVSSMISSGERVILMANSAIKPELW